MMARRGDGREQTALPFPYSSFLPCAALPNHPYSGATNAVLTIGRTEGLAALYKGLVPTLLGVAPYAAINFASYDLAKKWLYHGNKWVAGG